MYQRKALVALVVALAAGLFVACQDRPAEPQITASVGSTGEPGVLKFKYGASQTLVCIHEPGDYIETVGPDKDSLHFVIYDGGVDVRIPMTALVADASGGTKADNSGTDRGLYIEYDELEGQVPYAYGYEGKLIVDSVVNNTTWYTRIANSAWWRHNDGEYVHDNSGAARYTTASASPACVL